MKKKKKRLDSRKCLRVDHKFKVKKHLKAYC